MCTSTSVSIPAFLLLNIMLIPNFDNYLSTIKKLMISIVIDFTNIT